MSNEREPFRMNSHRDAVDRTKLERYLLEQLSDSEQACVEEQFFADDACFQELVELETDLIDQYVAGVLPADKRRLLESHFLNSPRLRERVECARALLDPACPAWGRPSIDLRSERTDRGLGALLERLRSAVRVRPQRPLQAAGLVLVAVLGVVVFFVAPRALQHNNTPQTTPPLARAPAAKPPITLSVVLTPSRPVKRSAEPGEFRTEQPCVGGLIRKPSYCSKSSIDRARRELTILKENAVAGDHNLAERQTRLGAVPLNEFIDCVSISRFDSGDRRLSNTADLL
jgi:hypothetical protein